jgi:anti-sigma factor RsiW
MTDHLSPAILNALADGELPPDQLATTNQHLAGCAQCTSDALYLSLLKASAARSGQRHAPASNFQERLTRQIREQPVQREVAQADSRHVRMGKFGFYGWVTACAILLASTGVFISQRLAERPFAASSALAALVTEACDQHIATLAANAPPQVISSDRHTVKPWFQGKLPFSFNLPDNLPSGITLDGANLTYIHNKPAAQLLYSIGKHHVSVYLEQKTSSQTNTQSLTDHSGFHVVRFTANAIDGVAVSDADPARLSDLVSRIAQVQD